MSPRLLALVLVAATACAEAPRRLTYHSLQSEALGREMSFSVYAPPGWEGEVPLPVVVFLHGGGDDPSSLDRAHLGQHLDRAVRAQSVPRAVRAQSVPRAVLVAPQGDLGMWENWSDGSRRYRDWVVREVLPAVRTRHSLLPCPEGCHLMGVSMGGYGALRFALLEPGLFGSVAAISAPIFDSERMLAFARSFWLGLVIPMKRIWGEPTRASVEENDLYLRWRRQGDLRGARLLLAWGNRDRRGVIETNEHFLAHLQRQGIAHRSFVFEGGHGWSAWVPAIERALREQLREDPSRVADAAGGGYEAVPGPPRRTRSTPGEPP